MIRWKRSAARIGGARGASGPAAHLAAAVAYYGDRERWNYADDADIDARHRGFFVRRRYESLMGAHPDWVPQIDVPTADDIAAAPIRARIDSELAIVEGFIAATIGTGNTLGSIFSSDDSVRPVHLDLADLARVFSDSPPAPASLQAALAAVEAGSADATAARASGYVETRRRFVKAIVWRASALEATLWSGSDAASPVLDTVALNEVLDRRLRTVEWMHHTIASRPFLAGTDRFETIWRSALGPTSGWDDGFRVRRFEYPSVAVADPVLSMLVAAHAAADIGATPFDDPAHPWLALSDSSVTWNVPAHGRYPANPPEQRALYFPPDQIQAWGRSSVSLYRCDLIGDGSTPAAAIDRMFAQRDALQDFMQRCLLYCDHVISAVLIESLLFGLRRREPSVTAADGVFNALCVRNAAAAMPGSKYVGLDAHGFTGAREKGVLMADAADTHFEHKEISPADLQVGDQVIFWNHLLYSKILDDEWRLENALVFDIQNDPMTGSIRWSNGHALTLCGHGMAPASHNDYQAELSVKFANGIGAVIARIQQETQRLIDTPDRADDLPPPPATAFLSYAGIERRLVRWTPYEVFDIDAWWIQVFMPAGASALEVLPHMPLAIVEHEEADGIHVSTAFDADPARGVWTIERFKMVAGYRPLPERSSLYFPLCLPMPAVGQAWHGYLKERTASGAHSGAMEYHEVDAKLIPGLLFFGHRQDATVVRPRVRLPAR